MAKTEASCAGVRIAYADPSKFGVDRYLALIAAAEHREAVVVAGVGTALTIDLLDADGQHHGGRIAASPTTMREALHARAVQLPAQEAITASSPTTPPTHSRPAAMAQPSR